MNRLLAAEVLSGLLDHRFERQQLHPGPEQTVPESGVQNLPRFRGQILAAYVRLHQERRSFEDGEPAGGRYAAAAKAARTV